MFLKFESFFVDTASESLSLPKLILQQRILKNSFLLVLLLLSIWSQNSLGELNLMLKGFFGKLIVVHPCDGIGSFSSRFNILNSLSVSALRRGSFSEGFIENMGPLSVFLRRHRSVEKNRILIILVDDHVSLRLHSWLKENVLWQYLIVLRVTLWRGYHLNLELILYLLKMHRPTKSPILFVSVVSHNIDLRPRFLNRGGMIPLKLFHTHRCGGTWFLILMNIQSLQRWLRQIHDRRLDLYSISWVLIFLLIYNDLIMILAILINPLFLIVRATFSWLITILSHWLLGNLHVFLF